MNHYFKSLLAGVTGIAMMSSCNKEDNTSSDAKDSRSALLIGRWKTTYAGENPDKLVPVMEDVMPIWMNIGRMAREILFFLAITPQKTLNGWYKTKKQ